MAKANGISNAQNVKINQSDDAILAHLRQYNDLFRTGTVDAPAVAPGNEMWFGDGNSPYNYNITDNQQLGIETGLKIHLRGGADVTPSASGPNGEQVYDVPAGTQSASRAAWNFDYVVNTAEGSTNINTANTLGDFTFKIQITASGGGFLTPTTATFDLDAATHVWVDEADPSITFGGDDFAPHNAASADVMSHVAENSVNLGFAPLQEVFGPLSQSTQAGTTYDVRLAGFDGSKLASLTHDVIHLT